MLHRVQSLGPVRGLEAAKMASWLLTGFELVAAERGLSPVLPPCTVSQAGLVGMRAAFTQQADSITKSCLQGGTSFVCDYGLWDSGFKLA